MTLSFKKNLKKIVFKGELMINMWMVRAGEQSFLIDEFIKNNIAAIGWDLGDLTNKSDEKIRELFKNKYKQNIKITEIIIIK